MGTYALLMGIEPSKAFTGKYVTLELEAVGGKVEAILTPGIARDVVEQEVKIGLSDATAPQVGPLLGVSTIVLRSVGCAYGEVVVIKGVNNVRVQEPEYFKNLYATNGCWVSYVAKGQERRLDISLGTVRVGPVLFGWTKDMGIDARIIGEKYEPPIMDVAASYAFPYGLSKNQLSVFNVALKMMIDPKFASSGRMTLQTIDSDRTTREGLVQLAHNEMMHVISKHRELTERDSTMLIEKYSRLCHYLHR